MKLINGDKLIENAFKNPISYTAFCNLVGRQPTVDAVPVTWIEGEIKWLKEMDNPFATMSAGQIEAMLKRWKDGDGNDTV